MKSLLGRGYDLALDKQQKRLLWGPVISLPGKTTKQKRIRQRIYLQILQLNDKGLTTSNLEIVQRKVFEHNVTIILLQETHYQFMEKLILNNYELAGYILNSRKSFVTFVKNILSKKLSSFLEKTQTYRRVAMNQCRWV